MTEITVSLPDEIYKHAARLSDATRLKISDILTDALSFTLPTLDGTTFREDAVTKLGDVEVLALAESQMPPAQDQRLSELLYRQREELLSAEEAAELLSLMSLYYSGWRRKTEALVEAVKRGLRPPLES
jgi:hypothetical protein